MKNTLFLLGIFTLTTISVAQSNAQEVARVNDKIITQAQVDARYAELTKQNPTLISRKAVIEDLIKRELAVQEAKRIRLDQDPAVMDRMNTVLFYSLVEKKLNAEFDRVSISDAEAKAWYQNNPEIRTSQIFIGIPPSTKPEEEKKIIERLNGIYRDIKAGKTTFGEAAQQFSEDPSSVMGGDMDYRFKDRLDPTYYRVAVKLDKPGEISTPVRLQNGIGIIRLTGKHTWIEADRSAIKRLIADEKRQAVVDQYFNGLRQKATISIR